MPDNLNESSGQLTTAQSIAVLPLSFMALAATGTVALIGIVEPGGSPGIIEAILAAAVVINIFFYLGSDKLSQATIGITALIGMFLSALLYTGSASRIGLEWYLFFPIVAVMLLRLKLFVAFLTAFLLSMIPALILTDDWQLEYSSGDLAGVMVGVVLVSAILSFYNWSVRKQMKGESEVRQKAAETSDLKMEIAQRQKAEAQMTDALRQIEESNRTLERVTAIDEATISSIGEAVLIVDQDGRIVRANPSSGRVLGINQEDIIGREITDKLSFEKQSEDGKILERQEIVIYQSIQHRSINDETYKITQPGGKVLYAQMTASPLVVSGEVYGAVVVVRDVTVEVGVDKAKSEFVSIASHQLRTPLSTINWYLEMVIAGDFGTLNDEQKEFIEEAYGAGKRMGDLINALLNASRLDVGVVAIEPEDSVDIKELLKGVLVDLEAKIASKGIVIKQLIDDTVHPMSLDTRIMDIIFLNLLTNAVKYSPSGSSVEIRGTIEGRYLKIEVSDQGYGIPANAQEKIFTKMFRADNAVEQEPDGNGLGLYIIKTIVETLGGSISFVSKEGQGTTFTVRIPSTGMEAREGAKQLDLSPGLN